MSTHTETTVWRLTKVPLIPSVLGIIGTDEKHTFHFMKNSMLGSSIRHATQLSPPLPASGYSLHRGCNGLLVISSNSIKWYMEYFSHQSDMGWILIADSILYIGGLDIFQLLPLSFPSWSTSGQTEKKAHMLPLLALTSSDHTNPSPHEGTLAPVPPANIKPQASLPSLLSWATDRPY